MIRYPKMANNPSIRIDLLGDFASKAVRRARTVRKWDSKNRARLNAEDKERRANDPAFRAKIVEYNKRYLSKPGMRAAASAASARWSAENEDRIYTAFLRRTYGLTMQTFGEMLVAQGGVCGICKLPPEPTKAGRPMRLCVDHNHKTGKIRGLLCIKCNVFIGSARESKEILNRAISYLEHHNGQ